MGIDDYCRHNAGLPPASAATAERLAQPERSLTRTIRECLDEHKLAQHREAHAAVIPTSPPIQVAEHLAPR